jgi:hypothetical protein
MMQAQIAPGMAQKAERGQHTYQPFFPCSFTWVRAWMLNPANSGAFYDLEGDGCYGQLDRVHPATNMAYDRLGCLHPAAVQRAGKSEWRLRQDASH